MLAVAAPSTDQLRRRADLAHHHGRHRAVGRRTHLDLAGATVALLELPDHGVGEPDQFGGEAGRGRRWGRRRSPSHRPAATPRAASCGAPAAVVRRQVVVVEARRRGRRPRPPRRRRRRRRRRGEEGQDRPDVASAASWNVTPSVGSVACRIRRAGGGRQVAPGALSPGTMTARPRRVPSASPIRARPRPGRPVPRRETEAGFGEGQHLDQLRERPPVGGGDRDLVADREEADRKRPPRRSRRSSGARTVG